jgi:hypothetical protein
MPSSGGGSSRQRVSAAKACARCGETATKRCTRCKHVAYCNVECQRNDWPTHSVFCGRPRHRFFSAALAQYIETDDVSKLMQLILHVSGGDVGGIEGHTLLHELVGGCQTCCVRRCFCNWMRFDEWVCHIFLSLPSTAALSTSPHCSLPPIRNVSRTLRMPSTLKQAPARVSFDRPTLCATNAKRFSQFDVKTYLRMADARLVDTQGTTPRSCKEGVVRRALQLRHREWGRRQRRRPKLRHGASRGLPAPDRPNGWLSPRADRPQPPAPKWQGPNCRRLVDVRRRCD